MRDMHPRAPRIAWQRPLQQAGTTGLLWLGLGLLGGCANTPKQPAVVPTAAVAAPAASTLTAPAGADALWPISPALMRTTSGPIYLGNLQSRIESFQRADTSRPAVAGALAAVLYARYRILGRFEDAVAARDLLDHALRSSPPPIDPELALLSARILAGFHQFDEAERLLAALPAESLRAERATLQRDIDVALGRYAQLQADFAASSTPIGDFHELAHRADLRVLQGDLAGAERQYRLAQSLYRDVDPMPLAWLHTQMGIALLRFGETGRARTFFAAATARLPGYALAEEHLAECEALLGDTDAARARYLRVIAQTDNPEFMAALAELESAAGHPSEADIWRRRAQARYAQLLDRHPASFAYHAVEFYLDLGETARALSLARDNLGLRGDIGSHILLLQAARAASETDAACAAWRAAKATGLRPPEWQELASDSPCRD